MEIMVVPWLAWGLAGLAGLGSVTLYLAAFFFPEVHRRHDFFWSGVGCFYALILWVDARQITPTEGLGHVASLSLMGWLGWQTLTLRRKRTPGVMQTPYRSDSWLTFRREMTALALDALRQTPLRRWLPAPTPATSAAVPGIRVSALKAVGYEFVDSLEEPDPTVMPRVRPLFAASPDTTPPVTPAPRARSPRPPANPTSPQGATANPNTETPDHQIVQRSDRTTARVVQAKPLTWGQPVQGLRTWVQAVVRARTAPKPKKPVIDIPPRPSSLAKRSAPGDNPSPPPSAMPPPDVPQASAPAPADPPPMRIQTDPETSNGEDDGEDWI